MQGEDSNQYGEDGRQKATLEHEMEYPRDFVSGFLDVAPGFSFQKLARPVLEKSCRREYDDTHYRDHGYGYGDINDSS
jgi:hypothetical protein